MKIASGPRIPTPFGGSVKFPDLETPPITLPRKPDSKGMKVIGHAVGEDLAQVIGLVPWVGDIIEDVIEDLHHREIANILGMSDYLKFAEYNKIFPSTVAAIRVTCFKEV